MAVISQSSFAGGIMSPMMWGRTDDGKYKAGLKECENFIVLPQGPVQNRGGLVFIRETKDSSKKSRLIPFVFSSDQTMMLEFGEGYIRFHSNGQTVLNDDGTPYEVQTLYDADDLMGIKYVQSADVMTLVHPKYPPAELRRYSQRDWRIEDLVLNARLPRPQNVIGEKATTGDPNINPDAYTFEYCVTALDSEREKESERSDSVSVTHNIYNTGSTIRIRWDAVEGARYYRVYKKYSGIWAYLGETEDLDIIDDDITPDTEYTPPRYDDPFFASKGIGSVTVVNGGSGYNSKKYVTEVSTKGVYVEEQDTTGSYDTENGGWNYTSFKPTKKTINLPTKTYPAYDFIGETGVFVDATGKRTGKFICLSTITTKHPDGLRDDKYDEILNSFKIVDRGEPVTAPVKAKIYETWNVRDQYYASSGHMELIANCVVGSVAPKVYVTDPTGMGAELKAHVSDDGRISYIDVIRAGYGYTNPKIVIDASESGGSGAVLQAVIADKADSYPATVTYFEQRRIFASTPENPQSIWMTRTGTESTMSYTIPSRDDDRVSFKISSRERNRINHLVPMNRLFVLTEAGEWVISSENSDAITASSVAVKGQSFVGSNTVAPVVFNNNMLYCAARGGHVRQLGYSNNSGGYVTGDVSLRAIHLFDEHSIVDGTFSKSPYPIAWFVSTSGKLLGLTYIPEQEITAWHVHSTDGEFESVSAVNEGGEYAVYCIVKRKIDGEVKRYVERMDNRDFSEVEDAFFVDCGTTYRGDPTDTLTGLDWLEGKTVNILADGAEMPSQIVENGSVSLSVEASVIHVGLPITAKISTLPPAVVTGSGNLTYAKKNVTRVYLRVFESSGIFIGPEDGELVEFKQRTDEPLGSPPEMVTGQVSVPLKAKWTDTGCVSVVQTSPLPLTILSIGTDCKVGG